MAKTSVGIDIGINSVKIAELSQEGVNKYALKKAITHYNPVNWDISEEKREAELAEFIKGIRERYGIARGKSVVIALPSNSVFVRYVDILETKRTKESDLIEYEARQQIPLSLDDVSWDYKILEEDSDRGKKALLIAVKKGIVENAVEHVKQGGLVARSVSLSLFCLLDVAQQKAVSKRSEGIVVIDIGLESTGIIISRGKHVWLRSFTFAGRNFTDSIAEAAEVDYSHAEMIKKEGPSSLNLRGEDVVEKVKEAIVCNLENLVAEVERTLNYYKMEYITTDPLMSEESFKKFHIFLTGGGSKIEEIAGFFEKKLDMSVSVLNVFDRVKVDEKKIKKGDLGGVNNEVKDITAEIDPLLSVAVSAAMVGFSKTDTGINFLKKNIAAQRSFSLSKYIRFFSYLFFAAALIVNFMFDKKTMNLYKDKLIELEKLSEQMDTYAPQVDSVTKDIEKMSGKNSFLLNFVQKRFVWLDVINSISAVMPDDLWLTGFYGAGGYEKDSVNELMLNGTTISYDQLNDFILAVRTIDTIEEVKPESVVNENETFNFLLRLTIKKVKEAVS